MKKYIIYIVAIVALIIGVFVGSQVYKGSESSNDKNTTIESNNVKNEIWTCSMHPQIRQNEPGECPICGMDLIPADSSIGESNEFQFKMSASAVKLANIQTTIIGESSDLNSNVLKLNGRIQADETKSASLVTHIPGRIEKLFVSFTGEKVSAGQKIATIYSPELITAQVELIESKKIIDITPELFNAAKKKLQYWKISDAIIKEIEEKGTIREAFDIYAQHSGVVVRKNISVGDYLSTGAVLFDLQNLNSVWALFEVYENDISKISKGSQLNFTTPAFQNNIFKSRISFIDPMINSSTHVITIRAEVQNKKGLLKPEMFIKGKLNIKNSGAKLLVPKSAVLWTGERSVVYIKVPDMEIPSFEYKEISIGERSQNNYVVLDGLKPGEEVVTNGAFVIDASSQLNNSASMMNRKIAKNEPKEIELPNYQASTPLSFKTQLNDVLSSYLNLKDALVQTDNKTALSSSKVLAKKIANIDFNLLKNEEYKYAIDIFKTIESYNNDLGNLKDVEKQRTTFAMLSEKIVETVKVFGGFDKSYFIQHCPMAINNTGADWISVERQIENPYFGSKMMKCGSVIDSLIIK